MHLSNFVIKNSFPHNSNAIDDWQASEIVEGNWDGGLLLICDHARNYIPPPFNNLGLPASELERHIAYDIGMEDLTRALSKKLHAPAVLSTFSRLLIDPNRGEDDPTVLMRLSDGAVVPGNRYVDEGEKEQRLVKYHRPYHLAISKSIDRMIQHGHGPILISLHSFTAVWRGISRPWHAGVLWDRDARAANALLDELNVETDLLIGDNEPYSGFLENDTMNRHGTNRGLNHALLEVRQDLVANDIAISEWAERLSPKLRRIAAKPEMRAILPKTKR